LPGFECAAEPQANVVCFRVAGPDELQLAVRDALIAEGSFYLSTAEVGGRRFLRMSIMNPLTTTAEIDRLVDRVRETASRLAGTGGVRRPAPQGLTG
jgi:L-2,4-diaminobutyrate decarboxylase